MKQTERFISAIPRGQWLCCFLVNTFLVGGSTIYIISLLFFPPATITNHNEDETAVITNHNADETETITNHNTDETATITNRNADEIERHWSKEIDLLLRSGDKALQKLTLEAEAEPLPWRAPSNKTQFIDINKKGAFLDKIEKLTASSILVYEVPYTEIFRNIPINRTFDVTANSASACVRILAGHAPGWQQPCVSWRDLGPQGIQSRFIDLFWFKMANPSPTSPFLPLIDNTRSDHVLLTYLHLVRSAVVDFSGVVFSKAAAIIPARCQPVKIQPLPRNSAKLPHYHKVFSLTEQTRNMFYHLTIEDLSRLAPYLDFLIKHSDIKLHVQETPFHRDMLSFLGISPTRLIHGDVRADIVYLPSGSECGCSNPLQLQLLAQRFHVKLKKSNRYKQSNIIKDTIVLIKRSTLNRQFKNHEDIYSMLLKVASRRHLNVKVFQDKPVPSLNETMSMFHRAVLVLAPHGAGMSNVLFSQAPIPIIEVLCESTFNPCFKCVTSLLGHAYFGVVHPLDCTKITPEVLQPMVEYVLDKYPK